MKTVFLLITFLSVVLNIKAQTSPREYVCYKIDQPIKIDGTIDDKEWKGVEWTNTFVDIEGENKDLPCYSTRVKMTWDDDFFYVAAELKEPHIWARLKQRDTVIFYDNDFEVFIDPQGDNHRYYEFEVNALNTIWDLLIAKPYRDGAPAINAWDIKGLKSAVHVYGSINDPSDKDEKWTLEIAFPWNVLKECAFERRKPKDGEQWRVNFSRVNWDIEIKDGRYKKAVNPKTGKTKPEHNWVWSPQGVIAMHQPETWGYVQFSTSTAGSKSVSFVSDEDYTLKQELVRLYKLQKKNYTKKGAFAKKIKSEFSVTIETTSKQFLIYAKGKTGKIWYIDHESKIWSN